MPQNKAAVSYFAASHLLQMHQANHLYQTVFLFSAHIVYMIFLNYSLDALHSKAMPFFLRLPAF